MIAAVSPAAISSAFPSFSSHSGSHRLELIAARVISELAADKVDGDDLYYTSLHTADTDYYSNADENGRETGEADSDSADDFEFSFVCRDPEAEPVTADELFTDGRIRVPQLFPIFSSDVVFHQPSSGGEESPSSRTGLELPRATVRLPLRDWQKYSGRTTLEAADSRVSVGDYCVWTPASAPASPDHHCKKSKSTGSTRRWRLRDLLHRSGSDGKDTILFISPEATGRPEKSKVVAKLASKEAKPETSTMAAKLIRRSATGSQLEKYMRERATREGGGRRSYLPYKQDIVGFFGNVNGLSRPHH